MLKSDTSRLHYIQKVSRRNGAQTRYLSTRLHTESQITYRKSAGGTVLKPRYLSTRLHTESQIKLEDGGQTHTSTTLQTLKLGGINVQ